MKLRADRSSSLARSVILRLDMACDAERDLLPNAKLVIACAMVNGNSATLVRDKERKLAAWVYKPESYEELHVVLGTINEFSYDDRLIPQITPDCQRYVFTDCNTIAAGHVLFQFFSKGALP